MVQPRYSVVGSERANRSLNRYTENIKSWPTVSDMIFRYLAARTKEAFNNEGRGVNWPDYWAQEPQYGAMKRSIFQREGQGGLFPNLLRWMPGQEVLFPSLMNPRHPDAVRLIEDDRIVYGTSVPYAARHQHGRGTNEQGEPIPARPFLVLLAEDIAEIRRRIAEHVGI